MRLTEKKDSGHWCLRDVPWNQLKPGVVITKEIWEKLYGALWKLKDYEDTGLSPEESMILRRARHTGRLRNCRKRGRSTGGFR